MDGPVPTVLLGQPQRKGRCVTDQERLEKQRRKILALQSRLRRRDRNIELWKHRYYRDVPKWRG